MPPASNNVVLHAHQFSSEEAAIERGHLLAMVHFEYFVLLKKLASIALPGWQLGLNSGIVITFS